MSHKTMIDGVAYEISGGKTLVNGTAYSIKNGKTLVGGTAYEVGFSKDPTIEIVQASSYDSTYAKVVINGQTYDGSTAETLSVPYGTIIECSCSGFVPMIMVYDKDQKIIAQASTNYSYEVIGDTRICTSATYNSMFGYSGSVSIYQQE